MPERKRFFSVDVFPYNDPVPPSPRQYRYTDPVPLSTNWYHFLIHHLVTQLDDFSFNDSFDDLRT